MTTATTIGSPRTTATHPARSLAVDRSGVTCGSVIESLGVYLPPRSVTTKEVLRGCKKMIMFPLEKMTGIHSRRMAGDGEYSIDLARKAVAECLALSRHEPSAIDLLICCNISRCDGPEHRFSYEPSTAMKLRGEFGFENAQAYDISNACAGMFTAIYLIDAFLQAGLIRRGMAVSGEYITHLTKTAQQEINGFLDPRLACLTVGDAGAAVILEQSPSSDIGFADLSLYTTSKHSRHCIAKVTDQPHGGAIMHTDPVAITTTAIKQGARHATHTEQRRQWLGGRFDHLIMHQTSETAMRGGMKELNATIGRQVCRDDNAIINVGERGNTATTSHLVAVFDHIASGRIRSGDRAIFGIAGSGQTVGTGLYTFDDLPDRLRDRLDGRSAAVRVAPLEQRDSPRTPAQRPRVRIESLGVPPRGGLPIRGTLPLVKAAVEDGLWRSSYRRNDIDLMLFAGVYRTDFLCEPAVAALAAGDLEINDVVESLDDPQTLVFDVGNGGVGFLNACQIAGDLIRSGKHRVALVTTSEVENNRENPAVPPVGVVETGSALILDESPDGETGFGEFLFKSYTEHIDRFESHGASVAGKPAMLVERDPLLEDIYLDCIADAVGELLAREKVAPIDLRVVLPPQFAPGFVARLAARLGIDAESCVDIAHDHQDYLTSSFVHAMRHAVERGMAGPGDLGLVIGVGAGIQVGCALYRF
jgi:3-oxoacyl-[acyl-carrier-protein] synthase III